MFEYLIVLGMVLWAIGGTLVPIILLTALIAALAGCWRKK